MIKNERYTELEATVAAQQEQIAALTTALAELQREPQAKTAPRTERGVRITHPGPVVPSDYPSANELDALNKIVGTHYPRLAYAAGDHGRRQFANAFRYLMFARRCEVPNNAYALGYWVDTGRQWLRRQGSDTYFTERELVAAAIVHGVSFTEPPYSSLGLTLGEHAEARKSAWRAVLASGQCPDPVRR